MFFFVILFQLKFKKLFDFLNENNLYEFKLILTIIKKVLIIVNIFI